MPTYSGGLGILAGDTARAAADLDLPIVFVTLISRSGYLRQELDAAGHQHDVPDPWEPQRWARALPAMVAVPIAERPVWVRPWLHVLQCPTGGAVPILLLDTEYPRTLPTIVASPGACMAGTQRCG
jgi:starch phosphorylase